MCVCVPALSLTAEEKEKEMNASKQIIRLSE